MNEDLVFEESNGLAIVEAEFFYKQTLSDIRQWYMFIKGVWSKPGEDHDELHCLNASNNGYLEITPDTCVSAADELIPGMNITETEGKIEVRWCFEFYYLFNKDDIG